jgi:hypothetical protein
MPPLSSELKNVEGLLQLLGRDLEELEVGGPGVSKDPWGLELERFRERAAGIRKIFDKFGDSDLSTRRYLRKHLDDEFASLEQTYKALRERFTSPNPDLPEGDFSWNGS